MIHQVFTGPVNQQQIKGAILPEAQAHFIVCTGDGSPSCGQMAEQWLADGRILPNMLASIKVSLGPGDQLWAGAFSAGGQIWKRVMRGAEDRAQIAGAVMSDAGYEAGWADEKNKIAPFVEGFVDFALDALNDGRLFVWTASGTPNVSVQSPGTVYPAGDQVQDATRAEIERRSGKAFADVTDKPELWPWGAHLRAPVKVWRLGNVILADYGAVYKHTEHATTIAPEVWQAIPAIVASGEASAIGSSWWRRLGPWGQLGLVLGGGAALVFGGREALKRAR